MLLTDGGYLGVRINISGTKRAIRDPLVSKRPNDQRWIPCPEKEHMICPNECQECFLVMIESALAKTLKTLKEKEECTLDWCHSGSKQFQSVVAILQPLLSNCSYFADYGEVLGCKNHNNLCNILITQPTTFVKSLRTFINTKLGKDFEANLKKRVWIFSWKAVSLSLKPKCGCSWRNWVLPFPLKA